MLRDICYDRLANLGSFICEILSKGKIFSVKHGSRAAHNATGINLSHSFLGQLGISCPLLLLLHFFFPPLPSAPTDFTSFLHYYLLLLRRPLWAQEPYIMGFQPGLHFEIYCSLESFRMVVCLIFHLTSWVQIIWKTGSPERRLEILFQNIPQQCAIPPESWGWSDSRRGSLWNRKPQPPHPILFVARVPPPRRHATQTRPL